MSTIKDISEKLNILEHAFALFGCTAEIKKANGEKIDVLKSAIRQEQGISISDGIKLSEDTALGETSEKLFQEYSTWVDDLLHLNPPS
jgi:hypothetical protein